MFSKNNQISGRQMFRLLTYDLLGIGTLLLPSALAGITKKGGMLAIAIGISGGILASVLFGRLTGCMGEGESYPSFLKRCFGTFFGTAASLFYALYYLLLGGYASYVFGHLIVTELLKEQSFYWIVAGILLLAAYGVTHGIEGRARVYEILFWFLLAPFFVMLAFAAKDVRVPRLFPVYTGDAASVWTGGYVCFAFLSLGGVALFATPFAKKKQSVKGALTGAVCFSGILFLALYAVLQGMFGTAALRDIEYPAVTLMSMIRIPGGFFQRQDALMVAVWFFTVFALIGSSLFYAAENLKGLTSGKKEKLWIGAAAAALFAVAAASYRSAELTGWMKQAFFYAATPLVILIPAAAWLALNVRGKGKKVVSCLFALCALPFLSGCSTQELENRQFPLAMGIDQADGSCQVSYTFQDLSAVADQNADAPGTTGFYIGDKDFFTAISQYANHTNKVMDYNHMKALILSESFAEDEEALRNFLKVCAKEELIARNTLLFFAENAAGILAMDKDLDTSVGTYLSEMMESREDYELAASVTLGDLFNDMANKEQLLLVPVLKEEGGVPVVGSYYAVSFGEMKGEVEISDAVLSYLAQGEIKKLAFSLEDGTAVSVSRIGAKGKFEGEQAPRRHTVLRLECVVEKNIRTDSERGEEIAERIGALFDQALGEHAKKMQQSGIDMTNSYYALGMGAGSLYRRYEEDPGRYARDLTSDFQTEVILLNEEK